MALGIAEAIFKLDDHFKLGVASQIIYYLFDWSAYDEVPPELEDAVSALVEASDRLHRLMLENMSDGKEQV